MGNAIDVRRIIGFWCIVMVLSDDMEDTDPARPRGSACRSLEIMIRPSRTGLIFGRKALLMATMDARFSFC